MTLIDELQQRIQTSQKALNIILKLNRARNQIKRPKKILKDIVELMLKEFEGKFCALVKIDLEKKKIRVVSFAQIEDNLIDYKLILRKDIVKKAINLQKIGVWSVKDLIKNRVLDPIEVATIPLKVEQKSLGALLIGRKKEFDKSDKEIIETSKVAISSILYQIEFMERYCKDSFDNFVKKE
jgi:hypothetical protein